MSDATGSEGLGELELDVSINDTQAMEQAQQLAGKIASVGQAASGTGTSGFRVFGSTAVSTLGQVITQANVMNSAFGQTSPLAPLMGSLNAVQGPLTSFGNFLDADTEKINAMKIAAGGLVGIGGIFVGIGGALTQVSRPLQDADAALRTSISNTKNAISGLPDSISNYTQQISAADAAAAKFGFSADGVNQALSQLTEETRSAPEAFKELQFTETLAAASHTNLANAASLVGRMHAGLFRSLRRFGIDIPSYLINPAKEAATAEGELEKATDSLQASQQALADFQQKLGAAEEARQQKFQAAAERASTAATTAQQRYQDSLQKTSDAEMKAADASQKAQQTISDNATKLAEDTQNAAQAVTDAQTKISDLEAQWAAEDSARQQNASDKAQQTADAIASAQEGLAIATAEWSTTPAKSAEAALRKLDEMRRQAAEVQKLQAQQAKDATAGQVPDATKISRQREMQTAQEQLNKAIEKQNGLAAEAAKMQLQNQQATLAATMAQQAYTKAQQDQAIAKDKAAEAEAKLAKAQQDLQNASQPSVTEQQQLGKLKTRVQEAQEAVDKANGKLKAAGEDQARIDATFQSAMSQFMSREKGLLEQRSNTWSGHLRMWEAQIKNVMMDLGGFAGPLATVGMAAMGVGSFLRMGTSIKDALKKIGQGKEAADAKKTIEGVTKDIQELEATSSKGAGGGGLEQLAMDFEGLGGSSGKGAEEVEQAGSKIAGIGKDLSKAEKAAGETETLMGEGGHFGNIARSAMNIVPKIGGAMSGVGEAIAGLGPVIFGPVGLVIAAIAGIAAIGYIIYRNWDTIKAGLIDGWNAVFKFGKDIFGDLESFFKRWGPAILAVFLPVIGIPLLIFQHWGQIKPFFGRILGDILGFFERLPGDAYNMIKSLMWTFLGIGDSIVKGIWNGLSNAGSWLYDQVKNFVKKFIESPITDFFSMFSPSRRMAGHGQNIAHGLALGMLSGAGMVEDAANRLAASADKSLNAGNFVFGAPGAGIAPSMQPTNITNHFQVNIPVNGTVVAEADLKNNIKTFLQQGATQNGGSITRFLGVPNASSS